MNRLNRCKERHILLSDQFAETLESILGIPDGLLKSLGTRELLVSVITDNRGDHTITVGIGNDIKMSIGSQEGNGAVSASKVDTNNDLNGDRVPKGVKQAIVQER